MLSGPFWTGDEDPWPFSQTPSREPIIQINLEHASADFGRDFGTGLIQIWKTDPFKFEEYATRYVSADTLARSPVTSVPNDLVCVPEKTHARRATSNSAPWAHTAILPVGWERLVSIHDELEFYLGFLFDDWIGPGALVAEARALRDACADLSTVDDFLFGNYYPRGYEASLDLLLAQISDKHFFWGDDGKAIVTCQAIAKPWEANSDGSPSKKNASGLLIPDNVHHRAKPSD